MLLKIFFIIFVKGLIIRGGWSVVSGLLFEQDVTHMPIVITYQSRTKVLSSSYVPPMYMLIC